MSHLSAFLMLGDPSPALSVELARTAVAAGATMLELGFPFSDPCADGPAIQRSCLRARAAGVSTPQAFGILARIREALPGVPLHLLVYGNLVHAPGYAAFCRRAAEAGATTLLVPDVPLEESAPLREACDDAELGHVQLVGPLTSATRLRELDAIATGFLYLVGYQGVTGRDMASAAPSAALVRDTVARVTNPVGLGFGLSQPSHIRTAFDNGAHIAIVGSHLGRAVERGLDGDGVAGDRVDDSRVVECFRDALLPLTRVCSTGEIQCS